MTTRKPAAVRQLEEEITQAIATAPVSDQPPDRVSEKREAQWARERALDVALQLHKQNGGMMTPEQVVAYAEKFLTFVTGETK